MDIPVFCSVRIIRWSEAAAHRWLAGHPRAGIAAPREGKISVAAATAGHPPCAYHTGSSSLTSPWMTWRLWNIQSSPLGLPVRNLDLLMCLRWLCRKDEKRDKILCERWPLKECDATIMCHKPYQERRVMDRVHLIHLIKIPIGE